MEQRVIEPQERRDKHNERNIEREACAGLVSVHGDNLIGIGEDWRHDDEERGHPGRQLHDPSYESSLHFVVVVFIGIMGSSWAQWIEELLVRNRREEGFMLTTTLSSG